MEGQANAVPVSSVAAPLVFSASFTDPGVTAADTLGGTLVTLTGVNLGPSVDFTSVSIGVPAGELAATNCTLTTPDTALQCVLPVATGAISRVTVMVLGQAAVLYPVGLVYAPPVIMDATPGSLPSTGATVSITGSGFGNTLGNLVLLVNGVATAVSMPVRVWD